jgi:hypothetical protein
VVLIRPPPNGKTATRSETAGLTTIKLQCMATPHSREGRSSLTCSSFYLRSSDDVHCRSSFLYSVFTIILLPSSCSLRKTLHV